jgi:hypothetical protein
MLFLNNQKFHFRHYGIVFPLWHCISINEFRKLMGQTKDFDLMFGVSAVLTQGSLILDYVSSYDKLYFSRKQTYTYSE